MNSIWYTRRHPPLKKRGEGKRRKECEQVEDAMEKKMNAVRNAEEKCARGEKMKNVKKQGRKEREKKREKRKRERERE